MRCAWSLGVVLMGCLAGSAYAEGWQAGTGRVAITPKEPTWMAGYAARTSPSEGALHDIWAKALALKDEKGNTALLITLDICGIDQDLAASIRAAIAAKLPVPAGSIALACSHTHSGPVLGHNLLTMYKLDEKQLQRVKDYTVEFAQAVVGAASNAIADLGPAELAWGRGMTDFAVNRRENAEGKVSELRSRLLLKGPVDHDVPVLRVRGKDGRDKAIVCGYACHCTVLDLNKINGDYAGFAQIAIEKAHPGTQAMFVAGCGADQNPQPRRQLAQAEMHGQSLATAVNEVLAGHLRPIAPELSVSFKQIPLAFDKLPTSAEIEKQTTDKNFYVASRARMLKKTIAEKGKLDPTYAYPIQVWNLGKGEVAWVFLGGEVVVDYALRIKRNLDPAHTWVTAYTNDVMAYIPSLRVLKEGGYEGEGAMLYYGRPARWSEAVEESIISGVFDGLKAAGVSKP